MPNWIQMLKAHYHEPNSLQTEKKNEPNNTIPLWDPYGSGGYENQIMSASRISVARVETFFRPPLSLPLLTPSRLTLMKSKKMIIQNPKL